MDRKKEEQLWQAYQTDRSDANRNALVEFYMQIVTYWAGKIQVAETSTFDVDDHISNGVLGLIDAIKSFDSSRGFRFSTFAAPRVRGAILDGIRQLDWVPRLERKRERAGEVETNSQLHLIDMPTSTDRGESVDPSERVRVEEFWAQATRGMCKRDRQIVLMHMRDGQHMRIVGERLGLSESRVSQIMSGLAPRLRTNLKEIDPPRFNGDGWKVLPRTQVEEVNSMTGVSYHDPEVIRRKIIELEQELESWKATLRQIEKRIDRTTHKPRKRKVSAKSQSGP